MIECALINKGMIHFSSYNVIKVNIIYSLCSNIEIGQ